MAKAKHIDRGVLRGKMSEMTGLDQAIHESGWTDIELERLQVLLDPPARPGLPPESISTILSEPDTHMLYPWGKELMQDWKVP